MEDSDFIDPMHMQDDESRQLRRNLPLDESTVKAAAAKIERQRATSNFRQSRLNRNAVSILMTTMMPMASMKKIATMKRRPRMLHPM